MDKISIGPTMESTSIQGRLYGGRGVRGRKACPEGQSHSVTRGEASLRPDTGTEREGLGGSSTGKLFGGWWKVIRYLCAGV